MKKILIFFLVLCVSLFLWATDVADGYIYGDIEVAYNNELPSGLFARTQNYLPGDSLRIANPFTGEEITVLNLGSLDEDSETAILISPEAANKLNLDMNQPFYVRITDRTADYDEITSGSVMLTKNKNVEGDWVFDNPSERSAAPESEVADLPDEDTSVFVDEEPEYVMPDVENREAPVVYNVAKEEPVAALPEYIDEFERKQIASAPKTVEEEPRYIEEKYDPVSYVPEESDYDEEMIIEEKITVVPTTEKAPPKKDIEKPRSSDPVVEEEKAARSVKKQKAVAKAPEEPAVEEKSAKRSAKKADKKKTEPELLVEEEAVKPRAKKEDKQTVKEDPVYEYSEQRKQVAKAEKPETPVSEEPVVIEPPYSSSAYEDFITMSPVASLDNSDYTSPVVPEKSADDDVDYVYTTSEEEVLSLVPSANQTPVDDGSTPVVVTAPKTEKKTEPVTSDNKTASSGNCSDDECYDIIVDKKDVFVLNPTDAKAPDGSAGYDSSKTAKSPVPKASETVKTVETPKSSSKTKTVLEKELRKGCCYVQIATATTDNQADNIIGKHKKYPLVKVPFESKEGYKIMVGPLTDDESGAILLKFKSFGYKDAYIRKIK